jgi:PAS domain S-box-containing protein
VTPVSTTLRVLCLEDDPRDAEIIQARLEEEGFNLEFLRVETEEAFAAALDQRTFDVILADYSLPSFDGMTALKLTRTRELEVPFVFVSGTIGEERAIELMRRGATDYVLKDRLNRLVPAITRALEEAEERRCRRKAERALYESEVKFRDFFNFLPVPLFEVDVEGRFLMVNRAFVDVIGVAHGDPGTGKNVFDLFPPEEADRVRENFRLRLCGAETSSNEFLVIVPGGALRTFIITTSAIVHKGRPTGLRGVALDITDRKRAEEEVIRLNLGLEQRVAERTLALEDANRELESFSYSVSHDLRAPLRTIDGFSQMILDECAPRLDEIANDYLHRIRVASRHMASLIDDLLQLSRNSSQVLRREHVDLSALARQILDELRCGHPERRSEIGVQDGVTASADPHLVAVALRNLLDNAWKFTGRTDCARIEFGAEETAAGREYFVRDNGAGFDPACAGRLFTPFQRLHAADQFPGTGIGLATVQRIVRRHGGAIRAAARPGGGAVFIFTLLGKD